MKKISVLFLFLFSISYSKFEKQFGLTVYENEKGLESYVTNRGLQYLRLNKKNSELEEQSYKLLIASEKIKKG